MSEINLTGLTALQSTSRFARATAEFLVNTPESQTTVVLEQKRAEAKAGVGEVRMSEQTMRAMLELNQRG